jgi:hypothetical protein
MTSHDTKRYLEIEVRALVIGLRHPVLTDHNERRDENGFYGSDHGQDNH